MLDEVDPFLQDDGGFFFEAVRDEDDVKQNLIFLLVTAGQLRLVAAFLF